jgi:hypothetical protein
VLSFFLTIKHSGAVKETSAVIIAYIILMVLIIIMQFGFGVAAWAVAAGSAPEVSGPFIGVLNDNYRYFDWKMLPTFWGPECYFATANATIYDDVLMRPENVTFHFPACDFDGNCALASTSMPLTAEEGYCCNQNSCDLSKAECASGHECVLSFLGKLAAP